MKHRHNLLQLRSNAVNRSTAPPDAYKVLSNTVSLSYELSGFSRVELSGLLSVYCYIVSAYLP
jgi:hypothetical protein